MRTLGAISASWTVCWATTYTFEPAFYDVEILRRLGDPPLNAVVLADDLRLARALDEMAGLDAAEQWSLRHANRTYLLRTVRLPGGVFHPKTILVGNRKHGRLLVGSGNIGFAGLDRGREVFHEFDSADPDDAPSFASYRSWMDRIVSYVDDGLLRHRWLALHGELPWLGANADGSRFLHNWSTPIVDQLVAGWQTKSDELHFTSPFFDSDLSAIARIIEAVQPRKIFGYLGSPTSVDGRRLGELLSGFDADVSLRAYDPPEFVHAKLVGLVAGEMGRLLSGSANLSAPALLHSSGSGNSEAGVLTNLAPEALRALFIPQGLGLRELDASTLDQFRFKRDPEPQPSPVRLIAATVEADGRVAVSAEPHSNALLLASGALILELEDGHSTDAAPDDLAGLVWLCDVRGQRVSNAVPLGRKVDLENALAAAQRRPDVPRDLDPSDLDHPLGKLLAALHGAAVFDVRDTPAFASANRSADRESPLDDDEIYEELLRQQLLDEPRAAAYRSWRRGSTPSDEDDFAWLVADMLRRAPAPDVVRLPGGGELAHGGNAHSGTPWTIDRRAADRAVRVLRRWTAALTDPRTGWYGEFAQVRHYLALLWVIAEVWPKAWISHGTLRDLARELLATFVHGGRSGGYLDTLAADDRAATLELLRNTEAPELAAAVSYAAVRHAAPNTMFAWQDFLGTALDDGVILPSGDAAVLASRLLGVPVTEPAMRERLALVRNYNNDERWTERSAIELGLEKVGIKKVNSPYPYEVTATGLEDLLSDRRAVALVAAALRYKAGQGIRLHVGDDVIATMLGRHVNAKIDGLSYSSELRIELADFDRLLAEDLGFGSILNSDSD